MFLRFRYTEFIILCEEERDFPNSLIWFRRKCRCIHISTFLKSNLLFNAGVCTTEEDERPSTEEEAQSFYGEGVCKWFNVRMGFGFLSMTNREGVPLDEPVDVFVHQVGF